MKIESKLGVKTKYTDENGKFLSLEDLVVSLKYYLGLVYSTGDQKIDDIDHLENRRVRSV
jgi:DNA-directed RNA polymerase beta subunit